MGSALGPGDLWGWGRFGVGFGVGFGDLWGWGLFGVSFGVGFGAWGHQGTPSSPQLGEQQEELEAAMNSIFKGVFVHRYRWGAAGGRLGGVYGVAMG